MESFRKFMLCSRLQIILQVPVWYIWYSYWVCVNSVLHFVVFWAYAISLWINRHVFWLFSHASGTCWTSSVLKMSYLEIASFQNHCWMMWRKRWKPLLELLPFVLLLCKDPVPGIHQSMTWVVWCLACGVLKVDSTSGSSGEFFFSFFSWSHGPCLMQLKSSMKSSIGLLMWLPLLPNMSFHPKIIPHCQSPTQSPSPIFVRHPQSEDWGKDCASDIDFVLLFNDADVSPTIFEELWQRTEVQLTGWTLPPGVPVSVSRGRFGLVASLSKDVQIEVDIIPALADPSGGHWIWDSVSKKVIHNNPKALAAFMEQRLELGLSETFRCWFSLWLGCARCLSSTFQIEDTYGKHMALRIHCIIIVFLDTTRKESGKLFWLGRSGGPVQILEQASPHHLEWANEITLHIAACGSCVDKFGGACVLTLPNPWDVFKSKLTQQSLGINFMSHIDFNTSSHVWCLCLEICSLFHHVPPILLWPCCGSYAGTPAEMFGRSFPVDIAHLAFTAFDITRTSRVDGTPRGRVPGGGKGTKTTSHRRTGEKYQVSGGVAECFCWPLRGCAVKDLLTVDIFCVSR